MAALRDRAGENGVMEATWLVPSVPFLRSLKTRLCDSDDNNDCVARVVIEHLTKIFIDPDGRSVRAVDDATFALEDKEFLTLVGPSGCGKTTTLRMIAGLEEISRGQISIDGRVVNTVPPEERDVAMIFQSHALYPHMSAY